MHGLLRVPLRHVRTLVWAVLDGVVISLVTPPLPQHRVLIIRPDAIGDFVLWSNAGRELCAHYRQQGYSVILLGNAVWAEWASDLGLADEVWALDTGRFVRNLWYRWSWLRRLRRAGFAKVIHPVHSRVFLVGDALARAANEAERVAPEGDYSNSTSWQKRWSDRWYSRLIPETSRQSMELLRHAEFMRGLGLSGFVARPPKLPLSKAASEFRSVSKPYAVLFVGGSWEGKVWQARNFGEIGRRLRECGVNVVLAGGPLDRVQATKILDCLNGNAIDLIEKTSLSELAELLRHAVVVLSNDTSAVHIGAAVDTPVLCILGGGHYGRFLPYVVEKQEPSRPAPIVAVQPMSCFGCNWQCIHPRERGEAVKCISDISVEQVWRHLEEVLPAWTRVKERIRQDS
jgi:ADP-heptose:LPS heptosyltransferase